MGAFLQWVLASLLAGGSALAQDDIPTCSDREVLTVLERLVDRSIVGNPNPDASSYLTVTFDGITTEQATANERGFECFASATIALKPVQTSKPDAFDIFTRGMITGSGLLNHPLSVNYIVRLSDDGETFHVTLENSQ